MTKIHKTSKLLSPIKSAGFLSVIVVLLTFSLLPADLIPGLFTGLITDHKENVPVKLKQDADQNRYLSANTTPEIANDSTGSLRPFEGSSNREPDADLLTVNSSGWTEKLQNQLAVIDSRFAGELGVYVKDLESGETISFRGDEYWYLASGIKIPVAITVLRGVERGEYSLDTKIKLEAADYVDGAGQTNWSKPGTLFTISHLLEEMLTVSDNTASDILIRLVGIEKVNSLVADHVSEHFGDITTLADVRRHTYSGFHERAFNLSGYDFIKLRMESEERERKETLAAILGINTEEFMMPDMDSIFESYYASHLNSGRLSAFGDLLEQLISGSLLERESGDYLMEILRRVKTGGNRIRAGLSESTVFAHKTGTQRGRTCDLGITGEPGDKRVIIAACTRGTLRTPLAEQVLQEVGKAVQDSGVFTSVTFTEIQP